MTLPNVPKDANMPEAVRGWLERVKRSLESIISSVGDLVIPSAASEAEAIAGTVADKYLSPLTGLAAINSVASLKKFAHYREEQPNNTDGGNPPTGTGAWNIRTLNTQVTDSIGTSLSSNEVTLPAGTYVVYGQCVNFRTGRTTSRLYNATDATEILRSTGHYNANATEAVTLNTFVIGIFTITASKAVRLETYITNNPGSGAAMGIANNNGMTEIYSQLFLWQVT